MPASIYSLTASELAPDIVSLLQMYRRKEIHEAVVRQVLKGACWWVSNAQGRRDACNRWSKAALAARRTNGAWKGLGLVHEHMVPRKIIEECILNLAEPTVESVKEYLILSQVCVVTACEDKRLREMGLRDGMGTDGCASDDIQRRYRAAGIEIAEEAFKRCKEA